MPTQGSVPHPAWRPERTRVHRRHGRLPLRGTGGAPHGTGIGNRYLQGDYASLAAAKAALPALQAAGFADAFVVGDVAGRLVPAAEALILLQKD